MQAEIGKEGTALSFTLPVFFFLGLLLCTVVEKSEGGKRPLSPGNRSCATQMVPSLPSNGILSH